MGSRGLSSLTFMRFVEDLEFHLDAVFFQTYKPELLRDFRSGCGAVSAAAKLPTVLGPRNPG